MAHSIKYTMDNKEINKINYEIKLKYLFGSMNVIDRINIETHIKNSSDEEKIKEKKESKKSINNISEIKIDTIEDLIKHAKDEITEDEIKDRILTELMSHSTSERESDKIHLEPKYWHCDKCNHDYGIKYKLKHLKTNKHYNNTT